MATTPENSPGGEEKGEEKEEQRSWNYERAKAQSYKEVVENAPAEFFNFKTQSTPKYENKTMFVMSLVSYLAPFATFIALIVIGAESATTVVAASHRCCRRTVEAELETLMAGAAERTAGHCTRVEPAAAWAAAARRYKAIIMFVPGARARAGAADLVARWLLCSGPSERAS